MRFNFVFGESDGSVKTHKCWQVYKNGFDLEVFFATTATQSTMETLEEQSSCLQIT